MALEELNGIKPQTLLNKITLYRRLNLRKVSDEDIIKHLREILVVDFKVVYPYENLELYRARKNIDDKLFLDESDIWSPPTSCVKRVGRLNNEGESLLYASLLAVTLPREIHLASGDWFTLIKYRVKPGRTLRLVGIGMGNDEHDDLSKADVSGFLEKNLTETGLINLAIINDFLRTEFSREVGLGTEYLYRTSLIIAKHFFPLRAGQYDGYLYFSVASKVGYNIALPSQIEKEFLQFEGLKVFNYHKEDDMIAERYYSISNGLWATQIVDSKLFYEKSEPGPITFGGITEEKRIAAEWLKERKIE